MSSRLSGLMDALHTLARDQTLTVEERTLAAERAIKGYLVADPTTRKEMLDVLENEVTAKSGDFWNTVGEIIGHLRGAA